MKLIKVFACLLCVMFVLALTSCGLFNKVYNITLDYNDGSGETESLVLKTKEDRTLPKKIVGEKIVEGWYTNPECTVKYDEENSDNMTVYAKWRSMNKVMFTADSSNSINDEYVIIENPSTVIDRPLRITEKCYILEIKGDGKVCENFSINISDRKDDLCIKFDSFEATGTDNDIISNYSANFTLHIENKGVSRIRNVNSTGGNALNVTNVKIYGTGTLSFTGGNGASGGSGRNGADAEHGENGQSGAKGGSGIVTKNLVVEDVELTVYGGNGGIGGRGGNGNNGTVGKHKNGGRGGTGGMGGTALITENIEVINCRILCQGGNGGNGGDGGNGGGDSKAFAGEGGNGGDGGSGGYGLVYNQLNKVDSYEKFAGGNGGNGGAGGKSERTSTDIFHWQTYNYSGDPGDRGNVPDGSKVIEVEVVEEKKWFSCNCK